jgi:hypothetical protein
MQSDHGQVPNRALDLWYVVCRLAGWRRSPGGVAALSGDLQTSGDHYAPALLSYLNRQRTQRYRPKAMGY